MKNFSRINVAIVGGSGLEDFLKATEQIRVGTPFGLPSPITIGMVRKKPVAFLPRHGLRHNVPPHRVNYRANLYGLHLLGVERIFATNAVGAIAQNLKPGTLVVPHDFVDFTKSRQGTFYDDAPVTHVDMSQPYCPEMRSALIKAAKTVGESVCDEAVLACTEGPRYETPAEVKLLRHFGCNIVGMTGLPEVVLARELEICYASLSYVSNLAVGLQDHQTVDDIARTAEKCKPIVEQVLKEAIDSLSTTRNCVCVDALKDSQL
ncbi:MAG: S-methyl-5'-thioadenosine phosphorylase [Candidatus Bathyarchaeota archaeon]|nr:MAG: S-methyl-5'-thioadenosine phosphorylase [Candidatus Bathyarchaeota archaeon]